MAKQKQFPFTAILGQEMMKEALLLNLVNPAIGGVLIRGQKGTAKSTAVRALAEILPSLRVVELPMNATEDRVAGSIDLEHMMETGEQRFEPGILKAADRQILYVDEINLLEDHIVNLLLDAAAMGVNTVEREGISISHPSRFILVGTMNPEEGELRPQLLDRFGMVVDVVGETDPDLRVQIIERRLAYEADPAKFSRRYAKSRRALAEQIREARELLPEVQTEREILRKAAEVCIAMEVQGHRADIAMIKAAQTIAALRGSRKTEPGDLKKAALYVLPHRMRRNPLETGQMDREKLERLFETAMQDSGKTGREDDHEKGSEEPKAQRQQTKSRTSVRDTSSRRRMDTGTESSPQEAG